MKAILERRSVRKFTEEPVVNEIIETLLRAAMAAPSAANDQPWHFIVINDRKNLVALASQMGYFAEKSKPVDRYDPSRVRFNQW